MTGLECRTGHYTWDQSLHPEHPGLVTTPKTGHYTQDKSLHSGLVTTPRTGHYTQDRSLHSRPVTTPRTGHYTQDQSLHLHAEHNPELYSKLHSGLHLSAILGAILSTFLDAILGTNLIPFAEAQFSLDLFQTQPQSWGLVWYELRWSTVHNIFLPSLNPTCWPCMAFMSLVSASFSLSTLLLPVQVKSLCLPHPLSN